MPHTNFLRMEYNLKADQEKAAKIYEDARSLVDNAKSEGRELNSDEEKQFDTLINEHQAQEVAIERKRKLNSIANSDVEKVEKVAEKRGVSLDEQVDLKDKCEGAFRTYLLRGYGGMTQEERQIMERAQTVGTNSEGGYTVDSFLAESIDKALLEFGGVRSVADVMSTPNGGDLSFVTNDDTGNVGELLAESGTAANQDTAFGLVTLGAYKYSSKAMYITRELLQDSKYDIVGYISELMAERIGRITNTHFTSGDGSSKPLGIAEAATEGTSTASSSAITFSEMLDLKHSVDRAYRNNATWMLNDSTLVALKKVAIASANQSLWQPGIVGGAPATIDGQAYTVNNDMDSFGTGTRPVIYGDMKKYKVRDVAGIEILRSDDLNMLKGQVTFVGFMRTDADLINTSAVKAMRMITT